MANGMFPFPLSGGVDLDGKPFQVAEGNLRKMQNVIPDKIGNPIRRPSMQALYPLSTSGGDACENAELHGYLDPAISPKDFNSVPPLWLSVPPMTGGFFIFGTASGSDRLDLTVSASDKFGGGARAVNCLMTAPSLLPSTFAKLGAQYIVYGPNPYGSSGLKISKVEDDAILIEDFNFEGSGNTNVAPRLVCEHQDRFVFGNFGDEEDSSSTIVFSDIDEPLVIGDDALSNRSLIVGFRDGQKLKALHSVMAAGAGTPAQSMLLALKTKSAYLLVGEPEETDSTDDPRGSLQVNRISGSAGCVSQASICDTPFGTIWCGPDDVWFMPFGSVPIPIGRKLRPLLKAQPESVQFRIHAVYDNGFYKLALFSDGQGPDNVTPLGEQWWLDLRDSAPGNWQEAKWIGPQLFKPAFYIGAARGVDSTATSGVNGLVNQNGTSFMAVDYREGAGGRLYGAQYAEFPTLENDGGYTVVLVTYDGSAARDCAAFFRGAMRAWQRDEIYYVGDEIVVWPPSAGGGLYSQTPFVFVVTDTTAGVAEPRSGSGQPNWDSGVIITDNEITWTLWGTCASPACVYGSEILTAVQTRESDLGTRMVEKLFLGAELALYLTTPECIRLTQLVDAGKTVDTIDRYMLGTSGPILGSSIFGLDMPAFTEEVLTESFDTNELTRTVGKSAQLKFEEVAGIVLPLDPTFTVIIGGEPYYVTLDTRYYATVDALGAAMVAAMNVQVPTSAHVDGWNLGSTQATKIIDGNGGGDWAPGVTTDESRFIWTLLGFTNFSGAEADTWTGNEVPYDVAIGNIGYVEAIVNFRPFKRRPL